MTHIAGRDRSQTLLLPESLDEHVGQENPVRFIDAFVDGLDLTAAGFIRVAPTGTGRAGYAPKDLLKFYIYGYLNRIRSIRRLEAETRRNIEVIWLLLFPTGGGRIEAYLGLAAFIVALRRLRNPGFAGAGLTVLMRYTLRLLTLDQLQRVGGVICALELERLAAADKLGNWPIEIGLWVGSGATPDRMGRKGEPDLRRRTVRMKNTRGWRHSSPVIAQCRHETMDRHHRIADHHTLLAKVDPQLLAWRRLEPAGVARASAANSRRYGATARSRVCSDTVIPRSRPTVDQFSLSPDSPTKAKELALSMYERAAWGLDVEQIEHWARIVTQLAQQARALQAD